MDIRKELKVSKEEICFLEDVDTLTEKEFNERYKGKKAEHREYVIPFEDAKTGDYYSDITISVNPGEGHNKGTTSITLCWDTYGKSFAMSFLLPVIMIVPPVPVFSILPQNSSVQNLIR